MDLRALRDAGREGLSRSTDKVLRLVRETTDRGQTHIKAKTADTFNFIMRQDLLLEGEEVVSATCSCGQRKICGHLAAVAAALLGEDPGEVKRAPAAPDFSRIRNAAPARPAAQAAPMPQPAPAPQAPQQPPESPAPDPEPTPASDFPPPPPPSEPEPAPAPSAPGAGQPPRSMRICLGSRENGEQVIWSPNDTEQLFHVNTGIIGTMGTGKTQCTKSIIAQLWRERGNNYDGTPMGILIFDYKGDYNETKPEFVRAVEARVLKPYRLPFNPLALIRGRAFKPLLPTHTANQFIDTISRIYRLGPKQQKTLMECIMDAYHAMGINEGNEATWNRTAPTFETVYRVFQQKEEGRPADSLAAAMDKLHNFCLFEPDTGKAQPLPQVLRGVVVMDLSQYDSDIQSLVVAITLDQFYAQMQTMGSSSTDGHFRHLRHIILVDEADTFMSGHFPSLKRIVREGREFGVGVILSTQHLTHFAGEGEDYSRYVLTWIVHNVSDLKQRDVEYLFRMGPKDRGAEQLCGVIKDLQKHESLLKLGGAEPEKIRDLPFFRLSEEAGSGRN